ncbi:DUF1592 domain-containing protein [Hyphococcus sp.]|uniref:DUF1592 domain-containing protein n=1 Tax=Hyphococcus sp. TaxID=2038636 RepID=UPI003CCC4165
MKKQRGGIVFKLVGAIVLVTAIGAGGFWFATNQGGDDGFEPGDPVMRRLTAEQYKNVIADLFGRDIELGGRFEPDLREEGLFAVGSSYVSVTGSGMEQYDVMGRTIASQVLDDEHRRIFLSCTPESTSEPDDACATAFLSEMGLMLFRRPLSESQLDAYVTAAAEATNIVGDFYEGLSLSLAAMLSAPEFLFIRQATEANPRQRNEHRLDAYSKASALSFFLWNSTPDVQLLEAAENGAIHTRKGLQAQVDRMTASPRLETGLRAFFIDNFRFDEFANLTKDTQLFPKYNAEVASASQEQTLKTITHLLLEENADYREIFTAKNTFLTPQLGALYQVALPQSGPNGSPEQWSEYRFSESDPRAGILTHASFTGLHSPAGRGSPTIRGKAVREVMLCQEVPAPPADVPFDLVLDTGNPNFKTARQRLAVHNEVASCAGCHKLMDPLGLALENFDGAGEFRLRENGVLIDTSGELDGAEFEDAVGLGQAISNSPSSTSCLVERISSYARGRAAVRSEQPWIENLEEAFADKKYRLPALMAEIALSDEFYRVAEPAVSVADNSPGPNVSIAMAKENSQ